jgi:hypothetical protein
MPAEREQLQEAFRIAPFRIAQTVEREEAACKKPGVLTLPLETKGPMHLASA